MEQVRSAATNATGVIPWLRKGRVVMQCPQCPTKLKMGEEGLVKCARHRFRLVMDDKGYRELVLAIDPKDSRGSQIGDRYPVVDNDETFA
jgi:hypothetical protein